MTEKPSKTDLLEQKVLELIARHDELRSENVRLRKKNNELSVSNQLLYDSNRRASRKVKDIISNLKKAN
ncbi:MAG: hypothetical protein OXI60_02825 [Acidiferrobacterales bacterium]|nr:hypothetical protein [Acidiferrobacterales bacterium]